MIVLIYNATLGGKRGAHIKYFYVRQITKTRHHDYELYKWEI